MQEGKTILREAVRGLRRALFGTAVGRIGVLAVLGLAVVYGMARPAQIGRASCRERVYACV